MDPYGCVMANTGIQSFNLSLDNLGLYAFRRCGVPRTEADRSPDHFYDMQMAGHSVPADLATVQQCKTD